MSQVEEAKESLLNIFLHPLRGMGGTPREDWELIRETPFTSQADL